MRSAGFISALIYTGSSVLAALVFFLVTTLQGRYSMVERAGGSTWIFILLMIILMPLVTPVVKKRWGGHE